MYIYTSVLINRGIKEVESLFHSHIMLITIG